MFTPVPGGISFPGLEADIGRFWTEKKIFEKSLQARADAARFVFYEGPPTANGLPHPGHCLTRVIKDLFPRYRTMRGYYCQRKAGWDTHGLPVEMEVCRELGIHAKEEIEAYGVEPFIHKCQESVWRYTREWERLTERLGFWIDLNEAYVTYKQSYVESVWWALRNLFDRGLLYQDHKIVWWWAQGGTALSAGEVGQGYRQVDDPSIYVRFPLRDDPHTSLLVWTTTPWTLPNNQFVAVHPDLEYVGLRNPVTQDQLVVAAGLADTIATKTKQELEVVSTWKGCELVGKRYVPPFDTYYTTDGDREGLLQSGGREALAWRVVAVDFVTLDSGTGVVHQAPAFGEVDFEVLRAERARFVPDERPELICAVGPDGRFTDRLPDYQGLWVKDADKQIVRSLRHRGLLFHQEQFRHEYPFCWRAEEDPLIQYPRHSWFVRTTQLKNQMLENNQQINWLPHHIKDGRFGNFLEANVDWALSRERYWGTPLPVWVCTETGYKEAISSYDELLQKPGVEGTEIWHKAKQANPQLPNDLKLHKPYIDEITYDSPKQPGARMQRVSEVIDCWFDSGAMPFAQWGYPHQGREQFSQQFPADFISEALDQTRGWFYSQLAISTLLFAADQETTGTDRPSTPWPHPFRNCVVLGLMLGEDGAKMSKMRRNYREPLEILDRYGADALRWYFFANQPPWTAIRYSEQAIKNSIPEFLLRLWNVYSFFVIYANIDAFDPATACAQLVPDASPIENSDFQLEAAILGHAKTYRPFSQRSELDRWMLSELNQTVAKVTEQMDLYDNYGACQRITELVDALSNWYVRRSRDRFWAGERRSAEKLDAYWTLYECLLTTCKLVAPFVPFLAEAIWQNLAIGAWGTEARESVHLCDFPVPDPAAIDPLLSDRMRLIREITSLGRSARMGAKLKVRQPLIQVELILADGQHRSWLDDHMQLIQSELNVKHVKFAQDASHYVTYRVIPNFKRLGPRLGKKMPLVKKTLAKADGGAILRQLETEQQITLAVGNDRVLLTPDDIQVRLEAKPGWAAAQSPNCVVVLATQLTEELLQEGLARELVRVIQDRRKELRCDYTDRIAVGFSTESGELKSAVIHFANYVKKETLAVALQQEPFDQVEQIHVRVANHPLSLSVKIVQPQ